jgi:hypothetical protein
MCMVGHRYGRWRPERRRSSAERSRAAAATLCVNPGKTGYFGTIGAAVAEAQAG